MSLKFLACCAIPAAHYIHDGSYNTKGGRSCKKKKKKKHTTRISDLESTGWEILSSNLHTVGTRVARRLSSRREFNLFIISFDFFLSIFFHSFAFFLFGKKFTSFRLFRVKFFFGCVAHTLYELGVSCNTSCAKSRLRRRRETEPEVPEGREENNETKKVLYMYVKIKIKNK